MGFTPDLRRVQFSNPIEPIDGIRSHSFTLGPFLAGNKALMRTWLALAQVARTVWVAVLLSVFAAYPAANVFWWMLSPV
jgi:hypothetical protein